MRKIIITGHGRYASGIGNTIETIAGKKDNIYYIDFTEYDTDITLREKFNSIIEENHGGEILFVCDILGGTPFKVAAEIANDSPNIELVIGCNVGGLLENILKNEDNSLEEFAESIVSSSKNATLKFKKIDINKIEDKNIQDEDGI